MIENVTLYTKASIESVAFKDCIISTHVKIRQLAIYLEQSQNFALRYSIRRWSSQWWRKAGWDREDKKYALNKVSQERFEWLTLFSWCRGHSNSTWVLALKVTLYVEPNLQVQNELVYSISTALDRKMKLSANFDELNEHGKGESKCDNIKGFI